jgi:hypothetical protein
MFGIPKALIFALTYAVTLGAVATMNSWEFKRRPEKRERYRALPIAYKLSCWFVVLPLFAGTLLEGMLFVPALVSFALLEGACVRWYRKAGLL